MAPIASISSVGSFLPTKRSALVRKLVAHILVGDPHEHQTGISPFTTVSLRALSTMAMTNRANTSLSGEASRSP